MTMMDVENMQLLVFKNLLIQVQKLLMTILIICVKYGNVHLKAGE